MCYYTKYVDILSCLQCSHASVQSSTEERLMKTCHKNIMINLSHRYALKRIEVGMIKKLRKGSKQNTSTYNIINTFYDSLFQLQMALVKFNALSYQLKVRVTNEMYKLLATRQIELNERMTRHANS